MKKYTRIILENADEYFIDLKNQALVPNRGSRNRLQFAEMKANADEDCLSFFYDPKRKKIFNEGDAHRPEEYFEVRLPVAILESRGIENIDAQHRWNQLARENEYNFRVSFQKGGPERSRKKSMQ